MSPTRTITCFVINAANDLVTKTIAVGNDPYGIIVSPDGKTLYVSNLQSNSVSVIATSSLTVTQTISVGGGPLGIGHISRRHHVVCCKQ